MTIYYVFDQATRKTKRVMSSRFSGFVRRFNYDKYTAPNGSTITLPGKEYTDDFMGDKLVNVPATQKTFQDFHQACTCTERVAVLEVLPGGLCPSAAR